MLNKLSRLILEAVVNKLSKYADAIEKYLAKEYVPDKTTRTEFPTDVPPAHWLEKVRQGAPHLLDQIAYENETESISSENNETEIQQTSSSHYQQDTELKKNNFLQQFVHKNTEKASESIKKLIDLFNETRDQPPTNIETGRLISNPKLYKNATQKFVKNISKITNLRSKETSSNISIQNQAHTSLQKRKNVKATKNTSNPQKKNVKPTKKTPNPQKINVKALKKTTNTQKTTDVSLIRINKKTEKIKRNQHKPAELIKHTHLNNKTTLHLHPKSIAQLKAKKHTQDIQIITAKDDWVKQESSFTDKDKKSNKTQIKQQPKNISSNKKTILSDSPIVQETINKPKDSINIRTAKKSIPTHLNNKLEKNYQQNKTKTYQDRTIDWTNFKKQTIQETSQDRWPQLPKQEWNQTKETLNQPFDFWQIQAQAKSKLLSDQEQRGSQWNV